MMRKKPKSSVVVSIVLLAFLFLLQTPLLIYAGDLTLLRDRLNRQKQNFTSGIEHAIVFTTELAVSGGAGNNRVIIDFPGADDALWCRTAGTLTPTGCTEDGATALPGTLAASCTQTNDQIVVTGVDDLLAATKYCVGINDTGTGDLGTPSASTNGIINVTTNNGAANVDTGILVVDIVTDDQITVMARVGTQGGGGGGGAPAPTEAIFIGKAYPNSPVTLLKKAQNAATTVADTNANFQVKLTDLVAGTYIFSLYGEDKDGRRSSLLTFSVIIYQNTTTYVSGIFIGPTIDVDKSEVAKGETFTVFGYSIPNADIVIYVNSASQNLSAQTVADGFGLYQHVFDTSSLSLGEVSILARAYYQNSNFGNLSKLIKLIVGTKSKPKEISICPDRGDFNNDCLVDIIDLSILIFWIDQPAPPIGLDLRKDGIIDIADFSVLTYYWTG